MKGIVVNLLDPEGRSILLNGLFEILHPILDEIDPLYWCFDVDIQPDTGTLNWLWGTENEEDDSSDGVLFDYLIDQEKYRIALVADDKIKLGHMKTQDQAFKRPSFIGADIFDIYRPHMMKTFGFALNSHGYGGAHFFCGFPAKTDEEAFNKINEICTDGDRLGLQYIFDLNKVIEHQAIFVFECYGVCRIFAEEKHLNKLGKHYDCPEIDSDRPSDFIGWLPGGLSFAFRRVKSDKCETFYIIE